MNIPYLRRFLDIFADDEGYFEVVVDNNSCVLQGKVALLAALSKAEKTAEFYINRCATADTKKKVGYDWVCVSVFDLLADQAEVTINSIYSFLRDNGFEKPVVLRRGNTIYLYYRTAMDARRLSVIQDFRRVLSAIFVGRDTEVNQVGIAQTEKIPLTEDLEIVRCPKKIAINKLYLFQRIVEIIPTRETPCADNNYTTTEDFDAESFFERHSIEATLIVDTPIKKWELTRCPFCDKSYPHKAYLLDFGGGALQFVCLHPVHSAFNFRDFRLSYDRSAYSTDALADYAKKFRYYAMRPFRSSPQHQPHTEAWIKLSSVKIDVMNIGDYIASGFPALDEQIIGFMRGHVSVWCGRKGCGKSSLLNQIVLNAAQRGFRTAIWSGELSEKEMKTWMSLQAAGKSFNEASYYNDKYYTPAATLNAIDPWFDRYISLYSNDSPPSIVSIEEYIRELHAKWPLDVVVLDNLMAMSISELGESSEWNNQKQLLHNLTKLAKELNIHIHLAAHPNKGVEWIDDDSIAGSNSIGNYAQNIFLISRIDRDRFAAQAAAAFPRNVIKDILDSNCTNIVKVAKCRDTGDAMGFILQLYYEKESKRFKSSPTEVVCYNWQEQYPHPLPDLPFVGIVY